MNQKINMQEMLAFWLLSDFLVHLFVQLGGMGWPHLLQEVKMYSCGVWEKFIWCISNFPGGPLVRKEKLKEMSV